MTAALPHIFRWLFTVLVVVMGIVAFAICVLMVVDPRLPASAHFGPATTNILGQPGTIALKPTDGDFQFTIDALKGNLLLTVNKVGGVIEILKHYGLPVLLINVIFSGAIFELLRRLFRNVGHGKSFTRQSVALVQWIGGALILYSFVSALAVGWLAHAYIGYVVQHAVITISGTPVRFPTFRDVTVPGIFFRRFPFGAPEFFSGLLVLALSEVFRQGLALKNENDLTV